MVGEIFLFIILSTILFEIYNKYISRFIIDKPVKRSSHKKDIPTSGGIIFIIIHFTYILLNKSFSTLFLLPIGIMGFFDDLLNIKQKYRLIFQFLNIFIILIFNLNFDIFKISKFSDVFTLFIGLFLGLTIVNCINFMDGIDGLVASNIFLIFLNYTFMNNSSFVGITIALFVFLFYNWSPAKLFMGDSGSTFLGLVLFYMIFTNKDLNSSLILLLTASPLLLDSIICIFRRLLNNENIFLPHKKHLYQRLHQKGMKHNQVSIIYLISTIILITFSYFNNLTIMLILTFLLFIYGIYLDKNFAVAFKS